MNALLDTWNTPFGLPPFAEIENDQFGPAFDAALAEARANIAAIANSEAAPTFANTIEAMELGEELLDRVASVFFNLAGAHTNDALQDLQRELSPKLAAFYSETMMNAALFARVKTLFDVRETLGLDAEQLRVLELYYRMFVRAGAQLEGPARDRLAEIMQELARLGTSFSQNVLADEKDWFLPLRPEDLEGLPRATSSRLPHPPPPSAGRRGMSLRSRGA